mgnify:CR=1 FL=1
MGVGRFKKGGKLDKVDVKILEGLALYDHRNKTKLAAHLHMSRKTLSYRINRLRSHFSLHIQGNIYHTNIGLRKAFIIAKSKPGYEELLHQCLKCNDYWLYVSRCIGVPACIATYGIPAGKESEFQDFINKLAEFDLVSDVDFFWSTSIHTVNATGKWFDETSEEWIFSWNSWLKEVQMEHGALPYTLKEPKEYIQKADWIDIMILKELEKNSTIKLKEIAKKLGTTLELIRYHYRNHVIKKQMFEGPQILADHYKGLFPDTCFFIFTFKNHENFTKFAGSLMDKPFVRAIGKVYGKNQLFVRIYLSRQQTKFFLDALSKLVRTGFLETYEYMIEDSTRTQRQTISYEFFKNNTWEYDHKKYVKRLQSAIKQFARTA